MLAAANIAANNCLGCKLGFAPGFAAANPAANKISETCYFSRKLKRFAAMLAAANPEANPPIPDFQTRVFWIQFEYLSSQTRKSKAFSHSTSKIRVPNPLHSIFSQPPLQSTIFHLKPSSMAPLVQAFGASHFHSMGG